MILNSLIEIARELMMDDITEFRLDHPLFEFHLSEQICIEKERSEDWTYNEESKSVC